MEKSSLVYGEFTIDRMFNAPVEKLFQMFADEQAKLTWFGAPGDIGKGEHTMDFQVGGNEIGTGEFHDGVTHTFKAHYYDIVVNKRIIYSYEMYLDDKRISVSVTSLEFSLDGGKSKLVLHESGVFLDDFDKPEVRKSGSIQLLDALEKALTK